MQQHRRRRPRRWVVTLTSTICLTIWFFSAAAANWSAAQDPSNNPDELNRKYQDALAQLKAAQDRKNELAIENEKMSARISELEKQLEESKRLSATFALQTFKLRSHYAAWEAFVKRYPTMSERWKLFLEADPLATPSQLPEMFESNVRVNGE
jgi:hypothetical protein